jgi:hypothetical protein
MIETRLGLRLGLGAAHQYGYVPRPIALLRARRERPRGCRAAEQRDELAAFQARAAGREGLHNN